MAGLKNPIGDHHLKEYPFLPDAQGEQATGAKSIWVLTLTWEGGGSVTSLHGLCT